MLKESENKPNFLERERLESSFILADLSGMYVGQVRYCFEFRVSHGQALETVTMWVDFYEPGQPKAIH